MDFCETPSTNTLHFVSRVLGKCSIPGSKCVAAYAARLIPWMVYEMAIWAGATFAWVPSSFVLSLLVAYKNRLSFVFVLAMYLAIQTALFLSAAAVGGFFRDVKMKLRYIGAEYDTVHKSTTEMSKETTYEPPDESFITIGAERFRCAEVLLLPNVIGTVCTHSLPPQRGRLLGMSKRRCATLFGITTHSSSRLRNLTRKRPTSSQTETSALSVLNVSAASKCFSSRPRIHDTSFQSNIKCDVYIRKELYALPCCHMARPCSKGLVRV